MRFFLAGLFSLLSWSGGIGGGFGMGAVAYATTLECNYKYFGAEFWKIKVDVFPDGSVSPLAEVSIQGHMHTETATAEVRAAGESVHLWLAKESEEDQIEMIVYEKPTAQGQSKLVNPRMPPFARDFWGSCAP